MSRRSAPLWPLRAVLTAGLLWWVLSRPEIRESAGVWQRMDLRWLAAGLLSAAVGQAFAAARWACCLHMFGIRQRPGDLFRITLAGTGAGFLSIGSLGADAVRVALADRCQPDSRARLIASVGIDHAAAFPGFAILAAVVVRSVTEISAAQSLWIAAGAAVVAFFATGLALRKFRPDWHARLRAFLLHRDSRRGFAAAALVSLPMLVFHYGTFWCTGRAIGVRVPGDDFLAAAAAADVVASLPVTIAGLGVREKAFETLLGRWHNVPPADAVTLSLAGFALLLACGAAGALWSLARRPRPAPDPA